MQQKNNYMFSLTHGQVDPFAILQSIKFGASFLLSIIAILLNWLACVCYQFQISAKKKIKRGQVG